MAQIVNVEKLTAKLFAHACPTLVEARPTVAQNVLLALSVPVPSPVRIRNVLIHVRPGAV